MAYIVEVSFSLSMGCSVERLKNEIIDIAYDKQCVDHFGYHEIEGTSRHQYLNIYLISFEFDDYEKFQQFTSIIKNKRPYKIQMIYAQKDSGKIEVLYQSPLYRKRSMTF